MDCWKKIISYIFTAGIIFTGIIQTADSNASCIDCHNDVWMDAQKKLYVHLPVANKDCTSCHTGAINNDLKSGQQLVDVAPQPSSIIADFAQHQHITWLAETFTPATRHFALLEQTIANDMITIEAWSQQRDKVKFDIEVPPLSAMDSVHTMQPATIEQVHLLDKDDLLLAHANIGWTTTSPCRCTVTYLASDVTYSLEEDDLYALQHNIILHNCSENGLVQINCTDPFDQNYSNDQQTIASLQRKYSTSKTSDSKSLQEQQISSTFKKLQQNIWLEVSAPVKFSVSIGTIEQQATATNSPKQSITDMAAVIPEIPGTTSHTRQQTANPEHNDLLDARAINLTICYRCHQNMLGWTSHPVDVIAQPGMDIPAEYPLLPGGRVSCMTCHSVHSSDKEYRLIKDSKRELCIGCHVNY